MQNRPFVPRFLKKADRKMLLHSPDCWSSRLHLVLYFSGMFIIVLALLSFFAFPDARAHSNVYSWTSFTGLACFIGLVIWLIYLLRFNVFKRYGTEKKYAGIMSFLRYFVAVFLIVLPTYVPLLVESFRANRAYSSAEIVQDLNSMNKNILLLNRDILPRNWDTDTFRLVPDNHPKVIHLENRSGGSQFETQVHTEITSDHTVPAYTYIYVNQKTLDENIQFADSLVAVTDSLFVRYNCPAYATFYAYGVETHSGQHTYTAFELYDLYLKNKIPEDKTRWTNELKAGIEKYYLPEHSNRYFSETKTNNFETEFQRLYPVNAVNNALYQITEKKYRWDSENAGVYVRVIYYLTLMLSLFVFVFRHSTVRTFFWSILSFIVLCILSAIILSFLRAHDFYIFFLMVLYYLIFAGIALTVRGAKTRQNIQGISLNLMTLSTVFIPLIVVWMLDAYDNLTFVATDEISYSVNTYEEWFMYAEIIGFVLLLLLIEPLIKKLYRTWYALPEH